MIYHVITPEALETARQQGWYEAASLASEGFIHLSTQVQVSGVLQRYYSHQPLVYVLEINEQLLTAPLRYELAPAVNENFPHLYGRLNWNAVVQVLPRASFEAD
jgi:uncharacterized protein (DUF952 family)